MKMFDAFKPGVLLAETHFPCRFKKGVIADAVSKVAEEGFYYNIEIDVVDEPDDRRRIRNIADGYPIAVTQWLTSVLTNEKLDLSSIDENLRKMSVARVKRQMCSASETGISALAVTSGPDPGPSFRAEAAERFFCSMCELCEALRDYAPMRLIFEPLDRGANKNRLIGPTSEAVLLAGRIRNIYPDAGISWDTAHAALCREDMLDSLELAREYIVQMHLSNAILDPARQEYGDHHMPIGSPGFLTVEKIAELFGKAVDCGLFYGIKPYVSVEVRTQEGADPWLTEGMGREALLKAWELYESNRYRERWDKRIP